MSTEEAWQEYESYMRSIVDGHIRKLSDATYLDSNQKNEAINAFFADFDEKTDVKANQLLLNFNSTGDRAVLVNRFLIMARECNDRFKSYIMNFNDNGHVEGLALFDR